MDRTAYRHILFVLLTYICSTLCLSATEPIVSKGKLDNYEQFPSKFVESRTVRVWTPSDYNPKKKYDVVYMEDGNALFDRHIMWNNQEWCVDETVDSLIQCKAIKPCIVVGIDPIEDRIGEYCPEDVKHYLKEGEMVYNSVYPTYSPYMNCIIKSLAWIITINPNGNDYLRFIIEEVKPFVDSHYSTYKDYKHTFTIGSSCGGLISAYALCKYPNVFGGVACMSTHSNFLSSFDWVPNQASAEAFVQFLRDNLPKKNTRKLYMDCGDKGDDAAYLQTQENINLAIRSLGWDKDHFTYRFFPGEEHNETCWARRLHIPFEFLLGK